jgi:hypothetical protein
MSSNFMLAMEIVEKLSRMTPGQTLTITIGGESSVSRTCSTVGAVEQLLRLAKAYGYERVWCDPTDETRWFAERQHPEKDATLQAIPLDWLL